MFAQLIQRLMDQNPELFAQGGQSAPQGDGALLQAMQSRMAGQAAAPKQVLPGPGAVMRGAQGGQTPQAGVQAGSSLMNAVAQGQPMPSGSDSSMLMQQLMGAGQAPTMPMTTDERLARFRAMFGRDPVNEQELSLVG